MVNLHKSLSNYVDSIQETIESKTPKRTGRLANSLKVEAEEDTITLEMLYYGSLLNSGTKYIKPTHFVDNSISISLLDKMGEQIIDDMWDEFVENNK